VVWVNSWFDPPKEGDAAQALLNAGADVLLQNTDSAAVMQTAEKAGKFSIGWNSDMAAFAPNGHLASAVSNWGPYYIKTVHDVMDGKWKVGHTWWGVKEGAIDLVSISDKVPAELKAKVEKARQGLIDGSVAVWKSPLVDNEGVVRLPADKVADDEFIEKVRFYVRGVEGKVPGESKS
jgi:basic membrane protein A